MSGFFLVRRDALELEKLRPHGFKILLEVLVRTPSLRRSEVPFTFGERHAGSSKASVAEARRYLRHLGSPSDWRCRRGLRCFGLVGLSGLAVNTLLLAFFTGAGGLYYLLSAVLATQGSTLWNLAFTEALVFHGRAAPAQRPSAPGHVLRSQQRRAGAARAPSLRAHVGARRQLPRLEHHLPGRAHDRALRAGRQLDLGEGTACRAEQRVRHPRDHRRHIGRSPFPSSSASASTSSKHRRRSTSASARSLRRASSNTPGSSATTRVSALPGSPRRSRWAGAIDIVASQAPARSPHVLYTNIVEPVLRWTFAERGYALAHAACLAVDDRAYPDHRQDGHREDDHDPEDAGQPARVLVHVRRPDTALP